MNTIPVAVAWSVFFGVMSGFGMLYYSAIFGVWFGKKNFGAIFGLAQVFGTFAAGFAPAAVGLAKEAWGSYRHVFEYLSIIGLVITCLMFCVSKPTKAQAFRPACWPPV